MKNFLASNRGLARPCSFAAAAAVFAFLSACGGGGGGGDGVAGQELALAAQTQGTQIRTFDSMDPDNWEIGPVVRGENYSSGVPLHPVSHPAGKSSGWVIDLPGPTQQAGSVHYVTMPSGTIAGKTKMTMRYRIEAGPGVQILPRDFPHHPSMLTLYFQRAGDNWSAQGSFEAYRWYAAFSRHVPIQPGGEYTIEARLDGNWKAILSSTRLNNPPAFEQALREADRVGFVLGGGDGAGHGVYATGPARLVVTSFQVE